MTIKHAWILFLLAVSVTLPLRVYQLFFLVDGETDFLKRATLTTGIIVAALVAVVVFTVAACRSDKKLHVSYVPLRNGVAAFLGALTALVLIFQSANMAPAALVDLTAAEIQETPNPAPFLKMVLAFWGIAAGVVILVAAYGFLRGRNPLRRHPLLALFPSIWGCVCMVLLFVMYTSKANISQNIYDMLTITCFLIFFFSQAKMLVGIEEERSVRMVYAAGLPAMMLALFASIPCLLLHMMGHRVPGEFPAGLHVVTLIMAIYVLSFLIMLNGLPEKKKDLENTPVIEENQLSKEQIPVE